MRMERLRNFTTGMATASCTASLIRSPILRMATPRTETLNRTMAEARSGEPRIVVVSPSVMAAPPAYAASVPMALPPYAQPVSRRFTVIGGGEGMPGESPENQEIVWRT